MKLCGFCGEIKDESEANCLTGFPGKPTSFRTKRTTYFGNQLVGEHMKEHPILFSGPMVQAILEGRKTQTRRVVKPQPIRKYAWYGCQDGMQFWTDDPQQGEKGNPDSRKVPYGTQGDRLWVKETWATDSLYNNLRPSLLPKRLPAGYLFYRADNNGDYKWRPSIFMPRWISRIDLDILNVRVERLQEISKADARAEGMECSFHWSREEGEYKFDIGSYDAYTANYRRLWDKLNGKTFPWDSNPWVWVYEFPKYSKEHQL